MAIGSANDNKIVLELQVAGQGGGLSENDRQLLNNFKENSANILKKTESDDILLANGETISKTELKGDKGDAGERGQRGERGIQGADGKSAYQSWLDAGNQGTEQDFLNSLQGQGLTETEKQQLLKKGTTKDILLNDGTTISKEDLLEGQISVPDDQFEFKFQNKYLWWKLKTEASSAWKKLLYNYELRPLDNQTLVAKVDRNRIYIKKQGEPDEKYKELLMGQWVAAFKYKVLDNKKIQWHSGLLNAEWVDMPFIANEENRRNTEGDMMVRVNTLRFVEDRQEKLINVNYPETFHIKILDGNYLQWKETTEDDTQWKRLPFHGENFHLKYALQARVQNGIIQYKFEFEDDTEYKDLVKTQDLFSVEGIKVISTKNIIGDTRTWLNVLFAYHRNILIKAGRYDLEALTNVGVHVHSNSNIELEEGAEFKVLPNPLPHFTTLRIEEANNVTIRGGLLVGDKSDHQWMNPKEDNYFFRSEQIHGVYITKSQNVTIENLTAKYFIGDGMLLSRANNVYVRNTKLYNARMEGLGIRSAENVVFDTCEFSFTSPAEASNFRNLGYGTDIEPIYNRNHFKNIKFLNCVFEDNGGFEPAGFSLSTAQHGSMKYELKSENEFVPTHVSIELINPVFKGCGLFAKIPTNWTHGYLRMFNVTVINSKRFGVAFIDHNSDNFHTYIDGLKLIDCGTELHWTGSEPQYYSRPLCFYSSANGNSQYIEQRNVNQRKGNKNIHIKNVEIVNSGKVTYRKAAITVYANPDKANDLENVQVENVKVVGYQKVFENLSKHQIHNSFQLTQHPETQLLNSDVVNKDIEIGNDSVHTFLNKTTSGNITFKDEIFPSNLEYYVKNSSTGEVKLKFETATDIEGLAYGVQEFALARGKRLKMRKIGENRWEYLEGTA
ncbi:right-handed parallel beta-helix repeat-containing protein [Capnocytophaga felis]|uniref:Right handed beta helix domain-containing protein n=1 Tax=Capnocytophaga felis TaxID=2267611 RepID=A0A5M4BBE0_9FLAO|nr:right-handed parallel beta-helix repeat-containing protein [Capnocytophaga felis]GET46904.1 hypothetical protein RCZ01_22060 [Capnocytophaga felis]